MALTININGLTLCHKGSGGISTATAPDVCKTPTPAGPVPIPYPNIAFSKHLSKGTKTIKVDGGNPAAIKGSEFATSSGDEPGTAGGVKSGTVKKEATWLTYSMDVKMEGKSVCRLSDKMLMNHGNTVCMGGEMQSPLPPALHRELCKLICDLIKKGKKKGERWMSKFRAKLAKRPSLVKKLAKHGWQFEKRLLTKAGKQGAAKMLKRAAFKKTLSGVGKRVAVKIPLIAVDGPAPVGDAIFAALAVYDFVTIIPDLVQVINGNFAGLAEIKFPKDSYRNGQFELYTEANKGKKPYTYNKKNCKC